MSRRHPGRFVRGRRFLQARLSPQGYLGLHLTMGLLFIVLGWWAFAEIAEDFSTGWLATMDRAAMDASRQIMTSGLTRWTRAVTALGSVSSLTVISLFLGIVFALRKAVYPLLLLALTMLGGSVLNMLLKHLFQRQRPAFENPLVTLNSYGFPSGHTMGTTLLCGALALIAAATLKSRIARASVFCLAAIWVMIIGASRIYLGAHYFTDVIGAIAAGLAWLAFCWTAVETLRRWRMRHGRHVAPVAT